MHNEVDQSKLITKQAVVSDAKNERANSSVRKEPLFKKMEVNSPSPTEEDIVTYKNSDNIHLRLSGSEEECVFSSIAPENKPTINVSKVVVFVCM